MALCNLQLLVLTYQYVKITAVKWAHWMQKSALCIISTCSGLFPLTHLHRHHRAHLQRRDVRTSSYASSLRWLTAWASRWERLRARARRRAPPAQRPARGAATAPAAPADPLSRSVAQDRFSCNFKPFDDWSFGGGGGGGACCCLRIYFVVLITARSV